MCQGWFSPSDSRILSRTSGGTFGFAANCASGSPGASARIAYTTKLMTRSVGIAIRTPRDVSAHGSDTGPVRPRFSAGRLERNDGRAVPAFGRPGGLVRADEGMARESRSDGRAEGPRALSVDDTQASDPRNGRVVQIPVKDGERLIGSRPADVELQRNARRRTADHRAVRP